MGKYEALDKAINKFIEDVEDGTLAFTLENLKSIFKKAVDVPKTVVYHPQLGSKSVPMAEKKKYIDEGWYDSKADFKQRENDSLPIAGEPESTELTDIQIAEIDKLVRSRGGMSLSSFVRLLGRKSTDHKDREFAAPIYNDVINRYGAEIKLCHYKNTEVYRHVSVITKDMKIVGQEV